MEVEVTGRQSLKSLPTSLTDYDVRAEAEAQDMIYGFIAFNLCIVNVEITNRFSIIYLFLKVFLGESILFLPAHFMN
ncbi:TPA: hypothetical protein ACG0DR_000655 [Enterobacter asburiae]